MRFLFPMILLTVLGTHALADSPAPNADAAKTPPTQSWQSMDSKTTIQIERAEVKKGMMTLWMSVSATSTKSITIANIKYMTADSTRYSPLRIGGAVFASHSFIEPGGKAWIKYPVPPGNPATVTLYSEGFDMLEIPVTYQ